MDKSIEFRVRPVTRYIVTKYTSNGVQDTGSVLVGEFPNEILANNAVGAFADRETIMAKPAKTVATYETLTYDNGEVVERVRRWERGVGWDDMACAI